MNMNQEENYKNKLSLLHQEQILKYYDELNPKEKENLIKQMNFDEIILTNNNYNNLIVHSKEYDDFILNQKCNISPVKICHKNKYSKNNRYTKIGEEVIKNGELAIVLLAGGLGTRLGCNGPKGTFSLLLGNKSTTLFESLINQAIKTKNKYGIYLPIYIMCSKNNYKETKEYFDNNNNLNYPISKLHFLIQTELPICDKNGKIVLRNKSTIAYGPDGNGDVFKCLYTKYSNELINDNTKWIIFSGIDNVLIDLIDPLIIGLTIKSKLNIASKSITKSNGTERGYVFARQNKKFYMIENGKQTNKIKNKRDIFGNYLYRETNITYHLVSANLLKKFANTKLPFHSALRKTTCLNEEGETIIPTNANTYKFEHYIYEAFNQESNMLVLSVDKSEFSPLKNKEGEKSIITVQEDYKKYKSKDNNVNN